MEILRENITYFKQTIKLSKSELIKIYKGAALGPAWALIKPTMLIFVLWFAFTFGLRKGGNVDDHPFLLWLIIGNVAWNYCSEVFISGANSLRAYRHLVTKIPFPVSTIMSFVNLSPIYVNFGLIFITVMILFGYGYYPTIYWFQIVYYIAAMYVFFVVLAWTTAPLSALSKDFYNLIKSLTNALFWLSGILWNPYDMDPGPLKAIVLANPITYIVNGYRDTFLYEKWFFEKPYETLTFIALTVILGIIGNFIYLRTKNEVKDVL